MFQSPITDVMARVMSLYLVQFIMGIVVGITFYYFSKVYNRKFLLSWSWSWFAFSIYMLGMFLVTEQMSRKVSGRLPFTMISQLGSFFHILYLLVGTYELTVRKSIALRVHFLFIGLVVFFALLSVWLFHDDPAAINYRYALRYGVRTLFSGLGFGIASFIVWLHPTFMRGLGQKMLALFFIIYSLDQLYYFSIIIINISGVSVDVPSFFGLVDLMLISFIGMAMIMWLLEDEREKLRIANNELDSFLYSASHDLRSPLASILGITNISKYEVREEGAKKLFAMIEERAKKLDLVIADILNLARSKKKDLKTEKIDFNKLLQDIASDIKFSRGAQKIRLEYDESIINSFYSDSTQLKIILGNLLSNAVKYHNIEQPDPYIKVSFKKEEKKIVITVQDNGTGIPESSQSRIFEMFYRASLNTEGTGLGLYITKEAVVKLRGEISYVSEEGKGTTFTVVLANPKVYS